jgi:hypothetical protein
VVLGLVYIYRLFGPWMQQYFRGFIMFSRSGNRDDSHRYQSAEDAFTSEGGHVTWEPEALEKDAKAIRDRRHPFRGFGNAMARYWQR